jgi:hypothetical protein
MSLYLEYGGDFVLNQFGGLQLASGWDAVRQRLERAILTSPATNLPGEGPLPPDYIFEPTYGAGAQREVGEGFDANRFANMTAFVQQALAQDSAVNPIIQPIVSISQTGFQQFTMTVVVPLLDGTSGTMVFDIAP